ncbi:MAG: TIM barrel protein [Sphaerobacter sp.]|nr:TIM barrel protein [Sphaerobacter sp.]
MTALLGNSSAPRWYQGDPPRLDAYLERLRAWGATATEVVLHHGPADERTARVHLLAEDWERVLRRYRDAGIAVQVHVSLDPRFATHRWLDDPDALKREYAPLFRVLRDLAAEQGRAVLVLHGAGDPARSYADNRQATVELLAWLAEEAERLPGEVLIALELGAMKPDRPTATARSRDGVLALVRAVDSPRVGICWDLAHDCENAAHEAGWTTVPDADFLARVVHVHAHDLGDDGASHYPPLLGRVPVAEQLAALARTGRLPSITMEVRWRCAARLGDPWELLGESYRRVGAIVARLSRR